MHRAIGTRLTPALPGWSVSGVMALYSKIKKKERYIL